MFLSTKESIIIFPFSESKNRKNLAQKLKKFWIFFKFFEIFWNLFENFQFDSKSERNQKLMQAQWELKFCWNYGCSLKKIRSEFQIKSEKFSAKKFQKIFIKFALNPKWKFVALKSFCFLFLFSLEFSGFLSAQWGNSSWTTDSETVPRSDR